MRFSLGYAILALAATALARPIDDDPTDPQPGTPRYDCHEACGNTITFSREQEYCQKKDFLKDLKSCLECADKFDIWKWYGKSVKEAATVCNMAAIPKAASIETAIAEATSTQKDKPTVTVQSTVTATVESKANGKSGLAKGAIAGIVVSCVVGAIAIIAGSVFACKRRRQKNASTNPEVNEKSERAVPWNASPATAENRV